MYYKKSRFRNGGFIVLKLIVALMVFLYSLMPASGHRDMRPVRTGGERIAYGAQSTNYMDLYYPETVKDETDVVFLIHGGAWIFGDQTMFDDHAMRAAQLGYIGVTVDYSKLSQKATATQMNDEIYTACRVLKKYRKMRTGIPYGKRRFPTIIRIKIM